MEPEVLVFLNTETVLLIEVHNNEYLVCRLHLHHRWQDPTGIDPVVKSTLDAKGSVEPEVLVFLKTVTD